MDLNKDGNIDILSGSYSHSNPGEMAGLFHVLWGKKDGTFKKAKPLLGTNKKPLIVTAANSSGDADLDRICTRPFAADLNGDGHLDIITGNFGGTFFVFWGQEGNAFDANSEPLLDTNKEIAKVPYHSDPSLIDWDHDGDLDLVSGSDEGGVYLLLNHGTKTSHRFAAPITLLEKPTAIGSPGATVFSDGNHDRPQRSTRVAVADVNHDGKYDLLIGDSFSIIKPVAGLSKKECKKKLAALDKQQGSLEMPVIKDFENMTDEESAALDAYQKKMNVWYQNRSKIVDDSSSGSVWLMIQK